jgi:hypothetical protein
MKFAIIVLLFLVLFAVCWPLAVAAILLLPVVWLVSLPFRLVFWTVEGFFHLVKAILFLPARVLGYRG